ncbi:MAG: hypothetical protein HQK54_12655 [Oligoflexales bacterium]|nr:hypothetical protein [Oligoflexales bacterium]
MGPYPMVSASQKLCLKLKGNNNIPVSHAKTTGSGEICRKECFLINSGDENTFFRPGLFLVEE